MNIVTFLLKDDKFGIEVEKIKEIAKNLVTTKVPLAPKYIEGLANLRGEVIPVINLRKKFNIMGRKTDMDIIITEIKGYLVGIMVDAVLNIIQVDKKDMKLSPEIVKSNIASGYLKGVAQSENERYILLDIEKII